MGDKLGTHGVFLVYLAIVPKFLSYLKCLNLTTLKFFLGVILSFVQGKFGPIIVEFNVKGCPYPLD